MKGHEKNKILLQSGTNELEVVEFFIYYKDDKGETCSSCYGVNVGKVREIIKTPKNITIVAKSHPSIDGIINFRGKIVSIINIPKWLGKPPSDMPLSRIIITEFNRIFSGFLVNSVSRIHRISWKDIEPPNLSMAEGEKSCITGIVKFDDRILMMLDFERIFAEITPSMSMEVHTLKASEKNHGKTILIAEDSTTVRSSLKNSMSDSGYNIIVTNDGEEAYHKLLEIEKKALEDKLSPTDRLHLLITDVEMPRMDGLHLLKKVREHEHFKKLPVIIFSSMATKENITKWRHLGASDYLSKPEISILMEKIRDNIL